MEYAYTAPLQELYGKITALDQMEPEELIALREAAVAPFVSWMHVAAGGAGVGCAAGAGCLARISRIPRISPALA